MADYYDEYSFIIPVDTDDQGNELIQIFHDKLGKDDYFLDMPQNCMLDSMERGDHKPAVWVSGVYGLHDDIPELIMSFYAKHNLDYTVIISGAYTCNKPRVDSFGGWAIKITKDDIKQIDCREYIKHA